MAYFNHPLYQPLSSFPYSGRKDSLANERFFQIIKKLNLNEKNVENAYVLAGFCSDEGVKRNLGRIGAKDGPIAFRDSFGELSQSLNQPLLDVGDILCEKNDLENAQHALSELVFHLQKNQNKTLIIGGGHEIGYGHFLGLNKAHPNKTIGIINFDAHFDLRAQVNGPSSGTPFLDAANLLKKQNKPFHYLCCGINEQANTRSLFETAHRLSVDFLTVNDIYQQSLEKQIQFITRYIEKVDCIYLTICLDVFNLAFAPGVSAPQALGLGPQHVLPLISPIIKSNKVISIDIAELSPPFDKDKRTTKLANQLAASMLKDWSFIWSL